MKNPKEEPKQHLIDMMKADEELGLYKEPKTGYIKSETKLIGIEFTLANGSKQFVSKQKTTLEEAAENYVNNFEYGIAHPRRVCKNAFINGAKSDAAKAYWYNIFKQNL